MIHIRDISKSYGDKPAVGNINLDIRRRERFGLIGPDGAGKTTLMRMICTLLLPDAGHITFNGRDVVTDYDYVRCNTGYMPGTFSLYQDLSVDENLRFHARVFGTTVADNLDMIGDIYNQLAPFGNRRAGALSGGMKQKLALCCALVHKPLVLVLDEPTTGVDAVSRKEFWEMLSRLEEKDITVVVSTPYMDEASRCHRIALMQDGRILTDDTPENIRSAYPYNLYRVKAKERYRLINKLRTLDDNWHVYPFGEWLHLSTAEALSIASLMSKLQKDGFEDVVIELEQAGVEDAFLALSTQEDDHA